jgi:Fe-S cluster assembly iron-binding protein IscA
MIDVSGEAIRELRVQYPPGEQGSVVRIVLAGRGCGGPIFELEPSSPTERDEIREEDRLTIVVEDRLVEEFKGISIRYVRSHWGGGCFEIQPSVSLNVDSCGDCRC